MNTGIFILMWSQVQLSINGNSPAVSEPENQSDAKTKAVAIAQ